MTLKQLNTLGIEQVAATACGLLGIPSHDGAAQPIGAVLSAADAALDGKGSHGCDDPSDMHVPHFYRFIGER